MSVPMVSMSDAEALGREAYGLAAVASPLASYSDQNVLLSVEGVPTLVLKIANASEERALLEAQQRVMHHLGDRFPLAPRVILATDGSAFRAITAPNGDTHLVWAVSVLPGAPLSTVVHRTRALHETYGATIATLTNALADFDDAACHRAFEWNLLEARAVVAQHRSLIVDDQLGSTIDRLVAAFDLHTAPRLAQLPRSVVHGDLHDQNILVERVGDSIDADVRISGVVDFGDMAFGWTIGDLAIAVAYAVLDAPDPLTVMVEMVRGYHAVRPLTTDEMQALYGLLTLRLCVSACLAAVHMQQAPDNAYLQVSQEPLRRTLPRLARVPFAFAAATVRSACGLEPVEGSARVREWLANKHGEFADVLGFDMRTEPALVLDLSVGSALVHGDARRNAEPLLTQRVFGAMADANVRVAVGRYDEPRLLYVTPAFASGDGTLNEHRTIHIGLDLFAVAGTPVFAPLDGVVIAADYQPAPLDYGGVIVLRHTTDDGTPFFTLYGHLSAPSFSMLRVGDKVARGMQIATLGVPAENGGWTPHLHLQIVTDFLGLGSEFPGVGTPSRRDVWRSVSPDANLLVGVPASAFPARMPSVQETLDRRRTFIGRSVRVGYRTPTRIVRGWKQYLYDDVGHRYLDAYNNVPHVGHCHPHVVNAALQQQSVLSTNTRYLHDALESYAERLTATLPRPLDVCFMLSSASEANELAIRLARTYTARHNMLVLDAAYHGNTSTLIDISPYKHAGPGGRGTPDWVHVLPLPDDYRGAYKRADAMAGAKFARDAAEQIRTVQNDHGSFAAFIAESCPSVGGQIMFPPGYLSPLYTAVRAAGGLCIADEVQTGLGRIGTHMWAFEAQRVVPDIVVMGKPLGNGYPLAAVVTTRAIADAFDNGMEFFSTFGGNTVACAVGNAVLDVLAQEQLQAQALHVGERLLQGLRRIADRHEIVGDVRGSGMFLGVELVRNRTTMEPATDEASYVSNLMRDAGILLGTDGPFHNVIKIRPPMPFNESDADQLLDTFDRVLQVIF